MLHVIKKTIKNEIFQKKIFIKKKEKISKKHVKKMSLPLIQINGKCEVPFYFVCICQKCYIICA